MRVSFVLPLLALSLTGCGGGYLYELSGDYGVLLSGSPSCVQVDVSAVPLEAPFTLDVYLKSGSNPDYAMYPVVAWPGAFAVYQDREGNLDVAPAGEGNLVAGVTTTLSLMDGGFHHLAVTQDVDGDVRLFLDGEQRANGNIDLVADPGPLMYVGCWESERGWFDGIIGELRFQAGVAYEGDFRPSWEEYVADEGTMALWHFNEGRGTAALESTGRADGVLVDADWAPFVLDGTERPTNAD